ncbi:MAG: hypothetical protein MR651_00670, partial [Faecalibacterium sp.]|nr:hypothetical protein [Faecalibacterium sp.]
LQQFTDLCSTGFFFRASILSGHIFFLHPDASILHLSGGLHNYWDGLPLHSLSAGVSCCTGVQTGGERWCCWRWCAGQASLRYCSSCCLPYFRFWYCFCVERGLISLLPLFSVIAFLYGFFSLYLLFFSSSFNCKPQVLQKYFRNPVNFTQMAFHNTSDDLP